MLSFMHFWISLINCWEQMNEGDIMTKIVYMMVPQGSYGIKNFYGEHLREYIEKNTQIEVIELDTVEQVEELDKCLGLVFSIDNYRSDIKYNQEQSIYQNIEVPHVNYIWSQVVYLNHSLEELSQKQEIFIKDRHQSNHLKNYYNLDSQLLPMFGVRGTKIIPWEKRDISVFFPASYLDENSILSQIEATLPEVMGEIAKTTISLLEKNKNFLIEETIEECLKTKGVKFTDDTIRAYMEEYGFAIDSYLNRKYRNKVLRLILGQGIPITVCGVNWRVFKETLAEKDQSLLTIIGENLSLRAVADHMGRAKIVLNLSPNLQDGIHERVTSGLMNGAICITDENPYMVEKVKDADVVELFQWNTSSSIPKKIRKILQQETKSIEKSKRAIKFGNENYSVDIFWKKINEV